MPSQSEWDKADKLYEDGFIYNKEGIQKAPRKKCFVCGGSGLIEVPNHYRWDDAGTDHDFGVHLEDCKACGGSGEETHDH